MGSPKKGEIGGGTTGGNEGNGNGYGASILQERPEEVDFTDLYWRIQKSWGHDPRFNAENFAFQPLYLIYQAYNQACNLEQERLYNQELPTAKLAWHYVCAHTEKEKRRSAELDFDRFLFFKPDNKVVQVGSYVANTIFAVLKDRKMPLWVFESLPRREIFANRRGVQQVYPRLWIDKEGDSIALFCPVRCPDSKIHVGAALLLDGVDGVRSLMDVDTGEMVMVKIPERDEPNTCIYGYEVKLL